MGYLQIFLENSTHFTVTAVMDLTGVSEQMESYTSQNRSS